MKRVLCIACVAAVAICQWVSPAASGPALDSIVNNFKLDQDSGGKDTGKWSTAEHGKTVGQTFKTGPNSILLSRIAVSVAGWSEEWSADESLTLTVYDSPEKKVNLGSYTMPFKWKYWEGTMMMFPINIPVKPNSSYFMEFTVNGGNGTIGGFFHTNGSSYAGGDLYESGKPVSGKDLAFETHVKTPWNKDADYAYYFDQWNLERPELSKVKAAVAIKNWDEAVKQLVDYYDHRTDLFEPMTPKLDPKFDRTASDMMVNMEMKDSHGDTVYLGPDWNYYITWPLRGGVGLTRTGIRNALARGYVGTADEKYAKAFNDMTLAQMRDQPSPIRAGALDPNRRGRNPAPAAGIMGGSMWSALSIGARMNNMWYFYSEVAKSPSFTTDARAAMIFNMVDMGNVQVLYKGGGNWETQRADSLLEFGQAHPELKRGQEWFEEGLGGMVQNASETIFPDGSLHEASLNYHGLVTNRFLQLLENARKNNFAVPASLEKTVEKMIDFMLYSTTWLGPTVRDKDGGWRGPATGDTFAPFGASDYFGRGAKHFGRKDYLWMFTDGKEGVPPKYKSMDFPASGWFVTRSGWDKDARFMHVHNGKNSGHGHDDELQMVVSAYGRELLIDPGIYVYGTKEAQEISRTQAHSTISVDGGQTLTEKGKNTWVSKGTYDYLDATNAGYGGIDGVHHRRRIVFVKPDFWVVVDDVTGPGSHKVDSRFVCAEGKGTSDGKNAFFTDGPAGLVISTPSSDTSILTIETGKRPAPGDVLVEVPVIRKSTQGALPVQMVQALVPCKGKTAPNVNVSTATQSNGDLCVTVSVNGVKHTVTFVSDGTVKLGS